MFQRMVAQGWDLLILVVVSLLFGIVKLASMSEKIGVRAALASIFISVAVGTLVGAVAMQLGWVDYIALMCSSLSSLLARDIVVGILSNKSFLGGLLRRGAENLTDKITK